MPATTAVGVRYMIDDVADAIAFSTTHLGFTFEQDAAPTFAAVTRDGVRLLLSGPTSSGPAAHARWHSAGLRRLEPPAPAGRRPSRRGRATARRGLQVPGPGGR